MTRTLGAAVLTTALLLAGCSQAATPDTPADEAAPTTTAAETAGVADVSVVDGWIKAQPDEGATMTGVFAVIENTTDAPVTVTGATTSLTDVTELHEVVQQDGRSVMQEIDGGFVIEPGTTRALEPGGDHLMVMGLTEPLMPGEVVTVTLTTDTGESVEFEAVAKTFSEGDERYHEDTPAPAGTEATDDSHDTHQHSDPQDEETS
ncbi:MAG: copper chaperone PCu(A)C [Mobilicoccus sp.]|nr:copper chaperone PCu(A)C [Mobilicoccus sp.]